MGPVTSEAAATLFGLPVATTVHWLASTGDAVAGDWSMLLIGIREDVTYDLSTEGVLTDGAGAIQVSAFQDDMTLMRVHFRVAAAVAQPVGPGDSPVIVERGVNEARTTAFAVIPHDGGQCRTDGRLREGPLLGVLAAVGAAVGTALLLAAVYRVRRVRHAVMELMHRITGK
jgi:hypothetical protein